MDFFHQHIDQLVGLFLMLLSLCLFIIPPKFGNRFYGIVTKWTLKNETAGATGQKLFAVAIFIIGLIFFTIGSLKLHGDIPDYAMFFLLAALWIASKNVVHKILEKKYSNS